MQSNTINVLIIDDHQLVADGLAMILSRLTDSVNIVTSYSVRSVLSNESLLKQQDLILVDLNMPAIDGFGFLRAMLNRKLMVPVVVISAVENRTDIKTVMQLGARGFIPKELPSAQMLHGLRRVLSGQLYVPDHLLEFLELWRQEGANSTSKSVNIAETETSAHMTLPQIRERQIEVLGLMHSGRSNSDIADILGISESTVKSHVSTLFKAFGVTNRTACVRAGLESKLIDL